MEKLVKAFPPPAVAIERGDEDTWPEMQNRVGSVLPRDYKDFINAYGSIEDAIGHLGLLIQTACGNAGGDGSPRALDGE